MTVFKNSDGSITTAPITTGTLIITDRTIPMEATRNIGTTSNIGIISNDGLISEVKRKYFTTDKSITYQGDDPGPAGTVATIGKKEDDNLDNFDEAFRKFAKKLGKEIANGKKKKELYNSVKGFISKPEDGVTIVFFNDNTKTIARVQDGEEYDLYIGIMVCILKHVGGGFGDTEIAKIIKGKNMTKDTDKKHKEKTKREDVEEECCLSDADDEDDGYKFTIGQLAILTANEYELNGYGIDDSAHYYCYGDAVIIREIDAEKSGEISYGFNKKGDENIWWLPKRYFKPFKFNIGESVIITGTPEELEDINGIGDEENYRTGDAVTVRDCIFDKKKNEEVYEVHSSHDTDKHNTWWISEKSIKKDEPLKAGVTAYITATDSELKDVGVSDLHQHDVVTVENYRLENGVLIYIVRKDKDKYTWEVPSTFILPMIQTRKSIKKDDKND
jgi:hypothetical protein